MEEIKDSPSPSTEGKSRDKTLALISHLSIIFAGLILPLILYLVKKDDVDEWTLTHIKEALNFHITLTIAMFICGLLVVVAIGLFLLPVVGIVGLVFGIIATIKASNEEEYKYPMSIRLVK